MSDLPFDILDAAISADPRKGGGRDERVQMRIWDGSNKWHPEYIYKAIEYIRASAVYPGYKTQMELHRKSWTMLIKDAKERLGEAPELTAALGVLRREEMDREMAAERSMVEAMKQYTLTKLDDYERGRVVEWAKEMVDGIKNPHLREQFQKLSAEL